MASLALDRAFQAGDVFPACQFKFGERGGQLICAHGLGLIH